MPASQYSPIAPRPLSSQKFEDRFFDHLAQFEGKAKRIHSDPEGIPSMGAGYALAHRQKDGTYRLMDRSEIDAAVSTATGRPYCLSDAEYGRLRKATEHLNRGEPDKAKAEIPVMPQGERDRTDHNKFGFTIPDEGQRRLIRDRMTAARRDTWHDIEHRARAKGWSDEQIADFRGKVAHSEEMVALASLKYNMGDGEKFPKTIDAMLDGDRASAYHEIVYRTNKDRNKGIANRRDAEGELFLGDRSRLSAADRERLDRLARENQEEISRYEAAIDRTPPVGDAPVSGGSGDKALGGGSGDDDLSAPPAEPMDRDVKTWSEDDARAVMEHKDYGRDDTPTGKARFERVRAYYALDEADRRPMPRPERPAGESPEWTALRRALFAKDADVDEIALKPIADWTEDEQRHVGREVFRLPSGDPRQAMLDGLRRQWFETVYGTDRIEFDDFGRMKEPTPVRPIPKTAGPARMADGKPMADGLARVAGMIRERNRDGGNLASAVKILQSGLNLVADARDEEKLPGPFAPQQHERETARRNRMALAVRASRPLKEDGVLGSKTRMGLKRTLAEHGPGKVREGIALGSFGEFAKGNNHRDLARETERTFGNLFRNPAKHLPTTASRPESGALQRTLNNLGPKTFGSGWEPLKEDGWIGPRTTSAFSRVAKGAGVGSLVRSFGSFLGFL